MAWYTVIFGKMWMKLMGISHEKMAEMKKNGMGVEVFCKLHRHAFDGIYP